MGALPNPGWNVVAFEVPTAAKWSQLGENDDALAAGTAFANNAIAAAALSTSAITLGYAQITSTFTSASATPVQVTGLTVSFTVPAGGRRIRAHVFSRSVGNSTSGDYGIISIWDGVVGVGTKISEGVVNAPSAGGAIAMNCFASSIPAAGAKTYNVGLNRLSAGTASIDGAATSPAFILIEAL